MTITQEDELDGLKRIGRIVANTLQEMRQAVEPGITTAELDAIGAAALARAGATSAPQQCYDFPGATCISVNEEVAHGIPGARVITAGDLVNIDVSAARDGFFADTGASFVVPPVATTQDQLCRDGHRAMMIGIQQVRPGKPLAGIGQAIGRFAKARGYTLIRNLASHGVGRSLHEEPTEIATWPTRGDRRRIGRGQVMTVEPFLSRGAHWADEAADGWTLTSWPPAPCVQFEHTVVATDRGPLILTQPG